MYTHKTQTNLELKFPIHKVYNALCIKMLSLSTSDTSAADTEFIIDQNKGTTATSK